MHGKRRIPATPQLSNGQDHLSRTSSVEEAARRGWNSWIASRLHEAGDLLAQQGANPFRAGAYHRAASAVSGSQDSMADVFASGGLNGLVALPQIGQSIAAAIAEMLRTGRWAQLECHD